MRVFCVVKCLKRLGSRNKNVIGFVTLESRLYKMRTTGCSYLRQRIYLTTMKCLIRNCKNNLTLWLENKITRKGNVCAWVRGINRALGKLKWKLYCCTKSPADFTSYKDYRNFVVKVVRKARAHCERKTAADNTRNSKYFHRYVCLKAKTKDKVSPLRNWNGSVT